MALFFSTCIHEWLKCRELILKIHALKVLTQYLVDLPEDVREETISPISGVWIQNTVQLDHTTVFGVDSVEACGQAKP